MSTLLISLPEELLERIIALAILPSNTSALPPAALQSPIPRSTSSPLPSRPFASQPLCPRKNTLLPVERRVHRYTVLLVSSIFARIGTAVLYSHVHLLSPRQCGALARTLATRTDLAVRVKSLRIEGVWPELHGLMRSLNVEDSSLQAFDMTIATAERGSPEDNLSATEEFCAALKVLPTLGAIKSLAIRKTPDAYLTLPGPASILECLSDVIENWGSLDTIDIGFRLLSGPRRNTISLLPLENIPPASPCAKFVAALSRAPSLRIVSTQLPAAWNSSLLDISSNPSLAAIRLEPSPPVAGPHHLFLVEAGKYPRLDALIRAGSPPIPFIVAPRRRSESLSTISTTSSGRLRANTTLGTSSPPPSIVAFPSIPSPILGESSTSGDRSSSQSIRQDDSDSGSDTSQGRVVRHKSGKGHSRQRKWSRRQSVLF
ncbi:hypothetical protein BDY19DRAFT_995249 [Irpex rosettiformis]|uniref:Uncharacterized protein n=1 Tax=Irpex rosettiformis TaxID=378272 RepID=A0ACB8TZC0_9APHY|nr:hypothetical protein BDY19DRAFT_995249 [Irpex rosettiformis]